MIRLLDVKGGIKMSKTRAWLLTLIGVLLILPLIRVNIGPLLTNWLIALAVLVVAILELVRNYSKKRR
jgi:hypothetical protein